MAQRLELVNDSFGILARFEALKEKHGRIINEGAKEDVHTPC